jgi:hypothetical protein
VLENDCHFLSFPGPHSTSPLWHCPTTSAGPELVRLLWDTLCYPCLPPINTPHFNSRVPKIQWSELSNALRGRPATPKIKYDTTGHVAPLVSTIRPQHHSYTCNCLASLPVSGQALCLKLSAETCGLSPSLPPAPNCSSTISPVTHRRILKNLLLLNLKRQK